MNAIELGRWTIKPDRSWADLAWLLMLLVPLRLPVDRAWLMTAAAIVILPPLYLWANTLTGPSLWFNRALTFGLGVALAPVNPFFHTLFIFAGMPAPRAAAREAAILLGLTVAASYAFFAWKGLEAVYFAVVSAVLLGLGTSILAARTAAATQKTLAGKDQEISRLARLAERERIARDLHDLLGHTLSLIAIKADLAHRLVERDTDAAAAEIAEVAEVARQALTDVRHAITGVRSIALPDALGNAEAVLEAAGLAVTLSLQIPPTLATEQEMTLAQAVLEATTNVVRHARGATRVSIQVLHGSEVIDLRIQDDGCGGSHTPGHGLRGMQARLSALGGSLAVRDLQPGTLVLASLPLTQPVQPA